MATVLVEKYPQMAKLFEKRYEEADGEAKEFAEAIKKLTKSNSKKNTESWMIEENDKMPTEKKKGFGFFGGKNKS